MPSTGITKFEFEKENEVNSGCCSKMTPSLKWPISRVMHRHHRGHGFESRSMNVDTAEYLLIFIKLANYMTMVLLLCFSSTVGSIYYEVIHLRCF